MHDRRLDVVVDASGIGAQSALRRVRSGHALPRGRGLPDRSGERLRDASARTPCSRCRRPPETGPRSGIVNMTLTGAYRQLAALCDRVAAILTYPRSTPIPKSATRSLLTFLDGLILQYAGPFPGGPNFAWELRDLRQHRCRGDPVVPRLIEEVRRANKMPSIKLMTTYLQAASQLGLGRRNGESRC